jgi:hypothetical protein
LKKSAEFAPAPPWDAAMTEIKWLQGSDGDEMLEFVADRLPERQWVLLAAAYVRRLWDLLPDGVLRQAVAFAERAETPPPEAERAEWVRKIDAAVPEAVGAAELAQRDIVRSCDPDAADIDNPILSRPNQVAPAFPLFQAASRHARDAIALTGEALTEASKAVRALFGEPSEMMLGAVRQAVEDAADTRTRANQETNLALRFKQEGDDAADRAAAAKKKNLEEARAVERVRQLEEGRARADEDDLDAEGRRFRAANKQLARLLREVVGNPFKPPRFEAAWRTSTAVELARGIFESGAWDRMPILADALLDADCDEEAVLRHLRGTEVWAKEPAPHVRGCWVIELVLGRWQPLPPAPAGPRPRPRRRAPDIDISLPFDDPETGLA